MTTWDLLQTFGLPLGMLLVALIAGQRRVWVWGTELEECRDDAARERAAYEVRLDEMAADYDRRLEEQRAAHLKREQELGAGIHKWQELFLGHVVALKGLTEVVSTAARGQGSP